MNMFIGKFYYFKMIFMCFVILDSVWILMTEAWSQI